MRQRFFLPFLLLFAGASFFVWVGLSSTAPLAAADGTPPRGPILITSTHYSLMSTLASGNGSVQQASSGYRLVSAFGEMGLPSNVLTFTSANYQSVTGFQALIRRVRERVVYRALLPMVVRQPTTGLPLTEGFETNTMPPAGWTRLTGSATSWVVTNSFSYGGSAYGALVLGSGGAAQNEVLLSPPFAAPTAQLVFHSNGYAPYCSGAPSNHCDLNVWLVRGAWDGGSGDDVLLHQPDALWGNYVWVTSTVAITPTLLTNGVVRLGFQYVNPTGEVGAVVIDEISVTP